MHSSPASRHLPSERPITWRNSGQNTHDQFADDRNRGAGPCPVRRSPCRNGATRGRSNARSPPHRLLALAPRRAYGGHDLPVHQPAVHAALLHRLHTAQHRILLPAHRSDAAVHVSDLSRWREGAAGPHPLVRRGAVRHHDRVGHLSDAQHSVSRRTRLGVHRRSAARRRRRSRDVVRADGSAAAHRRMEPAPVGSPIHPLSAVCRIEVARPPARHPIDAGAGDRLPRPLHGEPARHPYSSLRRNRDRFSGVRHGADDDRCWKILHQPGVCAMRDVPRRRRQGRHLSRARYSG